MLLPLTLTLATLVQTPYVRPTAQVAPTGPNVDLTAPRLAAEAGRALAVWHRDVGGNPPGIGVLLTASSKSLGRNWGPAVPLHSAGGVIWCAVDEDCTAVAGGRNLVVYRLGPGGPDEVWLRTWPAGQAATGQPLRLDTGHAAGTVQYHGARLAASADGQRLAILVSVDLGAGQSELRLLRSLDGGASFLPPRLVHAGGEYADVELAVDGNLVHVVWQQDVSGFGQHELRYQRSADGGQTWLPSYQVLAGSAPSDPAGIDLAVDGQRVAVAFGEISALCAVSVEQSLDGGLSWSGPVRVAGSLSPACVDRSPQVFHTLQDLVVSWNDDRSGVAQRWVAWTADGGQNWTEETLGSGGGALRLAGDPADGSFAALWTEGGAAVAASSRSVVPDVLDGFPLGPLVGNSLASQPALAYDPVYRDFVCAWRVYTTLNQTTEIHATGFRNATAEALGVLSPGGQMAFLGFGFPEVEGGATVQFLLSPAKGGALLPNDGRTVGLAASGLLNSVTGDPAFQGTLLANGVTASNVLVIPVTTPPGTTLHFAAVSFGGPLSGFGAITDPRTLLIQ